MRQIEIFQHLHHAPVSFFGGGIRRHAQLGSVIQRLIDGQLHVNDVFLWNKTNIVTDGIEMSIDIDVVDEYPRRRGSGTIPCNGIYKCGFPTAALPNDNDELARLERYRDILQNI